MNPPDSETGLVRVKFGARPDDSVPLSWAEAMLTEMRRATPVQFGKLLAKVVLNGDSAVR